MLGPTTDPLIRCPLEQLDIRYQVWLSAAGADKQDTRYTWHQHLCKLLDNGTVGKVCGPIVATINALLEIGWKPGKPDLWVVDDSTNVHLN